MSSGGAFFFLRRVTLVVGVLLFFEEFTLFVGVLACFLRRVALYAVLSVFGFFKGLLYLWGCLACGVAWLVGLLGLLRGGLLSLAFSVSINKLKIYEYEYEYEVYHSISSVCVAWLCALCWPAVGVDRQVGPSLIFPTST